MFDKSRRFIHFLTAWQAENPERNKLALIDSRCAWRLNPSKGEASGVLRDARTLFRPSRIYNLPALKWRRRISYQDYSRFLKRYYPFFQISLCLSISSRRPMRVKSVSEATKIPANSPCSEKPAWVRRYPWSPRVQWREALDAGICEVSRCCYFYLGTAKMVTNTVWFASVIYYRKLSE